MKFFLSTSLTLIFSFSLAHAQDVGSASSSVVPAPPVTAEGGGGSYIGFPGYVPSASPAGMVTGGSNQKQQQSNQQPAQGQNAQNQTQVPNGAILNDGKQNSPQKVEGFNAAIDQNFPMTPAMLRQYKATFDEQQRVLLERAQPQISSDSGLLTLEPGEETSTLYVSPGMFTAIGVYDNTGQPWPITQYVLGDGKSFQVIQLGEDSNNVTVTPMVPVGWTNLALVLKDEPKPIILKLEVSTTVASARRDIQIMKPGPKAVINTVSEMPVIRPITMPETDPITREAGNPLMMSALSGVDMPKTAQPVAIGGVNAKAWSLGGKLIVRSKSPLVSPSWSNSLAGPDGVFVYEIPEVPVALFSVNGQIVRADIDMP